MARILSDIKIPEYRPLEKVSVSIDATFAFHPRKQILKLSLACPLQCIETDETAKKPDLIKMPLSSEDEREAIAQLERAIAADGVTAGTH